MTRRGTTYSGLIESESEKGQLKIEILIGLRLNFLQIIALVIVTPLVEEPVHELGSDLSQSFPRQHVIRAPNSN